MWETILAGRVWQGEVVNKRKNGSLYTEDMTITPLTDADGAINRFIAIKQDVTERRQLDEALRRSRKELAADLADMNRLHALSTRFLGSEADLQVLLGLALDTALAITNAAKGHIQIMNVTTGELGITIQRGYDPAFVDYFSHIRSGSAACGTAAETRQAVVVEDVTISPLFVAEPAALQLVLAAGVRAMVCTPLLAHTGKLVGVLSTHFPTKHQPSARDLRLLDLLARQAADFIERGQAEQALRQTQAQLQTVTDTMSVGVTRCGWDRRYVWANRAYARWLGRAVEEVTGHPIIEVIGPSGYEAVRPYIEEVLRGRRVEWEAEVHFAGVGVVWISAVYTPTYDAAGLVDGWVAVETDMTRRKQAEEAQDLLAAIVEWSDDAILSIALDGKIRTWNAGAERMFGYKAREVVGRTLPLLIPPERLDEENEVLERLKRGETVEHYETMRLAKGGQPLDVSVTISPVKDSRGRMVGASKILRDIGEIVRARHLLAESKEVLEQLVEVRTARLREAMTELQHMSYSMVHDMRAPLRAMQSIATMIEQESTDCSRPPGLDYIRRIRVSANRLDRLITDALNYNRVVGEELPLTAVEVRSLLRGMIETYPNLQPSAADINIEFNDLAVLGNESLLTQCLGNLLGNAAKFVAPGVKPRIRLWAETLGQRDVAKSNKPDQSPAAASQNPQTPAATRFVRIWIEDNGIGIPKDAQEKIFRMFQRMHREVEYPGTGVGLAIVRKAAERMGGRVGLESEPGQGSRFWIELPNAGEARESNAEPGHSMTPARPSDAPVPSAAHSAAQR